MARPKVFAAGGYQGERVAALLLRDTSTWTLDIVKHSDDGKASNERWRGSAAAVVLPAPRKPGQNLPPP